MSVCIERGCCACCMEMGSPPFIPYTPEHDALPERLKQQTLHVRELQDWEDGVPCAWLNVATRKCVQYELRPDICREFGIDGDGCRRNIERESFREFLKARS